MSSVAETVLDDIVAAVRASSTFAARADNVVEGALDVVAETPKAAVNVIGLQSSHDDGLGQYRRTLTVSVMAAVGATTTTAGARARAALAVLDELAGALETALRAASDTAGHGIDVLVQGESFDGADLFHVDVGIVVIEVQVWWIADSGSGT